MMKHVVLAPALAAATLMCLAACSAEVRNFGSGEGGAGGASGPGGTGGEGAGMGVSSSAGPGSSSSSGSCTGVEQCFNGVDDDCDGDADCADDDCAEPAVCVAAPTNFELGTLVGEAEPCPEGFTMAPTLVHRGLSGGDCQGCGCTPNPTRCAADIYTYASAAACQGDTGMTGGTLAGRVGFECINMPIRDGFVFGVRTGTFIVDQSCTANGSAEPVPARWAESRKFCRAVDVGAGCAAGEACVPKRRPSDMCALVSGSASCEGYRRRESNWYRGYDDSRSCGSCGCFASGGGCDSVRAMIGSDWACDFAHAYISEGDKDCSQVYSPPAHLVGKPRASTCEVRVQMTGSIDPTGQSTLCCLE